MPRVSKPKANPTPVQLLSKKFGDALRFAAKLHREQPRKGTTIPYVSHLFSVAALVLEHGGDWVQAVAALLDDPIEDQGGSRKDAQALKQNIRRRFGDEVLAIVVACSDADDSTSKKPWRRRKEDYLAHLPKLPRAARIVSMADKLHNARCILADHIDIGREVWKRFNASQQDVIWYYESLCAAYRKMSASPPMLAGKPAPA
jgi:(p)ppGpp synthase/HD superfamily hydrolase